MLENAARNLESWGHADSAWAGDPEFVEVTTASQDGMEPDAAAALSLELFDEGVNREGDKVGVGYRTVRPLVPDHGPEEDEEPAGSVFSVRAEVNAGYAED